MSKSNELSVSPTATPRLKPGPDDELVPGRHFTDHAYSMRWTKRRSWHAMAIAGRDAMPSIRPTSAAVNYGQAVVEGLMAYRMNDGTISVFRPDSHIKRLNNGARRMALPQVDFDRVWSALRRLVDLDSGWLPDEPGGGLYLRAVLAANGQTLDLATAQECLFYVLASPVAVPQELGAPPAWAMVLDDYARALPGGTGDINASGNYGAGIVPGEIAVNYGYDHVLWLDGSQRRFVQQAGVMNVFFVMDGVLTTPRLDQTILPGITRDSVIKLARDAGTRVDERTVELPEVLTGISEGRVTECFGTGTAQGIVAFAGLAAKGVEYSLPGGAPGPVTAHFQKLLDGIHRGELIDRFGWMRRLSEVAPVHA